MDVNLTRLAKIFLPRIPYVLALLVLNKLSLSANSDKQDATVETTVYVIRTLLSQKRPLGYVQQLSLRDRGVKGKIWISKVAVPAPDAHVRDAVMGAIKDLGDGNETVTLPEIVNVEAEWTGYRSGAQKNTPRPDADEKLQYQSLMQEVTSPVAILYFHGGAHCMMDPASHRDTTSNLARRTGGRCLSVRYRLAPQNPFPAALLDALTAYLYLLSPTDESYHEPVAASNIVFAGDSAGGNLASALMLLILTLRRKGVKSIQFHGKAVPLELPAGMALNSPWCDIGRSLPSIHDNAQYDYLDPPAATGMPAVAFAPGDIWPTDPPRAEIYCQASLMNHPLVSPVVAPADLWAGVPPVFVCGGTEGLLDEYTVMARHIYQAGATVDFVGYEGMPHCFALIFSSTPAGQDCFHRWAQFCVNVVKQQVARSETAPWMKAFSNPPDFRHVQIDQMGPSDKEVQERMNRTKEMALEREHKMLKDWEARNKAKI